jgi:hypothetical protein
VPRPERGRGLEPIVPPVFPKVPRVFARFSRRRKKLLPTKRHPALEGLLKLREETGILFLERDGFLLALFHLEEGRLLKATGLVSLVPDVSSGDPR